MHQVEKAIEVPVETPVVTADEVLMWLKLKEDDELVQKPNGDDITSWCVVATYAKEVLGYTEPCVHWKGGGDLGSKKEFSTDYQLERAIYAFDGFFEITAKEAIEILEEE